MGIYERPECDRARAAREDLRHRDTNGINGCESQPATHARGGGGCAPAAPLAPPPPPPPTPTRDGRHAHLEALGEVVLDMFRTLFKTGYYPDHDQEALVAHASLGYRRQLFSRAVLSNTQPPTSTAFIVSTCRQ